MADPLQRASVGFVGGQVLALRVAPKELERLARALEVGDGWHEVATDDGPTRISLAQVAYVRIESDEHRVGFGV